MTKLWKNPSHRDLSIASSNIAIVKIRKWRKLQEWNRAFQVPWTELHWRFVECSDNALGDPRALGHHPRVQARMWKGQCAPVTHCCWPPGKWRQVQVPAPSSAWERGWSCEGKDWVEAQGCKQSQDDSTNRDSPMKMPRRAWQVRVLCSFVVLAWENSGSSNQWIV